MHAYLDTGNLVFIFFLKLCIPHKFYDFYEILTVILHLCSTKYIDLGYIYFSMNSFTSYLLIVTAFNENKYEDDKS